MAKIQVRVVKCDNDNVVGKDYTLDTITGKATNERGNLSLHQFRERRPGVWVNSKNTVLEVLQPVRASDQAFKADAGKPRYDLLMDGMPHALLDVVKVLSWAVQEKKDAPWPEGGKGYAPHSWQEVPEAKRRYRAALQRHENAIARGEINDPESGLPHRAHVATNALFLAELDYLYPEIK